MTCFLAEAANNFDVRTSFAKMSRVSTSEAGSFLFLLFESLFIFIYLISIFILLTRRKAMEALIHRVGNYPYLLPEMPRYCCPLEI